MLTNLEWLFPWLLFLHVIAAIVAFGPTFGFPIIGAMGGREREHANFATRISLTLSQRIVLPLALTMPITGFAMIFVAGIDLSARANWWLGIAIILYAIAIGIALANNLPAARRVVALTSTPPGPSGPPAELPALVGRIKRGGMINSVLIVVIVFLMVVKPQF